MIPEPTPASEPENSPAPEMVGAAPEGPVLGGYQLVQKLTDTADGQIWMAMDTRGGPPCGMTFLNQPAMRDPGAVWRVKQTFAQVSAPLGRMGLLVVDPPLGADQSVSIQHIRSHRPATAVNQPAVPQKVVSPEDAKRNRRLIAWLVSAFLVAGVLLFGAYSAAVIAGAIALHEHSENQMKAAKSAREAWEINAAADAWAAAQGISAGTPYTWDDIKSYAPKHLSSRAVGSTGPLDVFGRPYVYKDYGTHVTVDPATQAYIDAPPPNIWGFQPYY